MTRQKKKNRTPHRQQISVVALAFLIIALSVFGTLHFTGVFAGDSGSDDAGYRNVTFTDAFLECDSYTRERYAPRLQTLTLDNHSSRYDNQAGVYKIFMQLQMRKPPRDPLPRPYWVNCFVSTREGRITHYQVGEDKDAPVEVRQRDQRGFFDWP